ncbi:hypothetical protein STEG23_033591 [Scotinomys teguina]
MPPEKGSRLNWKVKPPFSACDDLTLILSKRYLPSSRNSDDAVTVFCHIIAMFVQLPTSHGKAMCPGNIFMPQEDPDLVSSITWWLTTDCNSSSRGSDGLLASESEFTVFGGKAEDSTSSLSLAQGQYPWTYGSPCMVLETPLHICSLPERAYVLTLKTAVSKLGSPFVFTSEVFTFFGSLCTSSH